MPRIATPLSDTQCRTAKPRDKDYKLFDGRGLYLLVKPTGVKSWRFKYTKPDGRAGLTAFGSYPALSLKAARECHAQALALLARGLDPVEQARQARNPDAGHAIAFETVARAWHATMTKWSQGHARRVLSEMESDLFPVIGKRRIVDVKTRDLLIPLQAVEKRGALDTAARLRQRCTCIMRYAVQTGLIDYNPAHDLAGALTTRKAKHRPALPLERLPELLARIDSYRGRALTGLAVRLALAVFIRSSELRFARWEEIDLSRAMWTIPGERQPIEGVKFSHRGAKMGTPHLVPLSRQAVDILECVRALSDRFDLVFPGDHYQFKPMSENTVNSALRRMGYNTQGEVCGHGFRAMACSALVESGLWSRDAVERQMSHQERNGVRAAYIHKAEHLDERRLMVQWWADYLDANRKQHITPYDFAQATR
ncbi:tyrosine-type recombinase/integrase [Pseudomonas aeruginosa]|uniref:tyrosine-type recombinase/integrase n=1 Tax=Pseudomonas aeruginosa TaxID=287 RepID=UPI001D18EDCB|nr:integrase arm-type DNA-binding domain-containing protein [Pseudomonas aeruginosa]MCC4277039.1 integrase arm-type DNA-binding domain-containing protein [Pseudomonas aeruginosa]